MKLYFLLFSLLCGISAQQILPCTASSPYPQPSPVQNDTTTGTALYKLADITTSGNAIISAHGNSAGAVGVAVAGAGTTGTVCIAHIGPTPLYVDGTTTIGHCVVRSTTTDGEGHDTGTACTASPTAAEFVGIVMTASTGAGSLSIVMLKGGFMTSQSGSGGGSGSNITSGTYASLPATCTHTATASDMYQATDAPYKFICTATNTWTAYYGTYQVVVPPQSWTAINSASSVINGTVYLKQAPSGRNVTSLCNAQPAGNYTIDAMFLIQGFQVNYGTFAVGWRESATAKLELVGIKGNTSNNFGSSLDVIQFSNSTTFGAEPFQQSTVPTTPVWIRLVYDGTNLKSSWSSDGSNWQEFYSEAKGAFFTSAPDQVCLHLYQEDTNTWANVGVTLISWYAH